MPGDRVPASVRRQVRARAPGWLRAGTGWIRRRLDAAIGGPDRRHVVLVLACVLTVPGWTVDPRRPSPVTRNDNH